MEIKTLKSKTGAKCDYCGGDVYDITTIECYEEYDLVRIHKVCYGCNSIIYQNEFLQY